MENSISDIYTRIGQRIVDSINDEWSDAKLHIVYIGAVETSLKYNCDDESKNIGLV